MKWFDIEKINEKSYIISENKHYEETNIYYLIGENYNLCIDTGIGLNRIKPLLKEIDDKDIKVINSHSHWDHIGNNYEFKTVFLHNKTKKMLSTGGYHSLEKVKKEVVKNVDKKYIPNNFNIDDYKLYNGENSILIEENQVLDLGNRQLEVIYTPGHTECSITLFEKQTGYLFVGDFFYEGTLYLNSNQNNYLDYYNSLKKLRLLPNIQNIFCGHFTPNLGADYVDKIYALFENIHNKGNLIKGSGKHVLNDVSVIL